MVRPLTGFGPSSETPSGAAVQLSDGRSRRVRVPAPPMRFSTPSAFEDLRVGQCVGTDCLDSVQAPSHLGLSQTLVGLILAGPCGLVSCRCRSWGLHPSELFPANGLYQVRRLAIPSRCSLRLPRKSAAPSGVSARLQSASTSGVLHPLADRCSPGFHRLHGLPALRAGFASRRIIRS
jgi:hypothetical protein